jgi:decaprenyl-phosphate phosphoribosyltransferase
MRLGSRLDPEVRLLSISSSGHLGCDVQVQESSRPRSQPIRLGLELTRAARPRQWLKNLLIASVPLAAGRISDSSILRPILLTIGVWCFASSAVYLFNDVFDLERDRSNPARAHRPITSGALPVPVALTAATVLLLVAIPAAWSLVNLQTAALLASYVALQILYSARLKNEPVFELAIVASGFVLRTIAGGFATGLDLSPWFLLVAIFGALFMVSGKRYSEFQAGADHRHLSRPVLEHYSASFLRFVWTVSAGITILTYALWAIEGQSGVRPWWIASSVIPLTIGVLRYTMTIDSGRAGDPEDVVLGDRVLLTVGAAFVAFVVLGMTDAG